MPSVLETIKPEIAKTIKLLKTREFKADPIAGASASKITSIVSSAYKRHGNILELAIRTRLSRCKRFVVWHEPKFHLPTEAEGFVTAKIGKPESIVGNDLKYESKGRRTLQLDLIVYDKTRKTLRAYEIKRGFGQHDSGKKKQMLRDILCVQVLLRSYGRSRGLSVKKVQSHIIFYYGQCSLKKPFSVTGAELDEHFGFPVKDAVEKVNGYFKNQLLKILPV